MPSLVLSLFIIASLFQPADAAAQSSRHDAFGRYQQVTWQERDGLPQNTVIAIATTRDGYLWMGTYEGAVRFDGVRFTLFNPSTTTGIGNSFVTSLLERRDGDLWLATYGGGVSRLSGGQFTQYARRDGLSSDFVWCLFEDHAGTLWIGTDGGGVNAFSAGPIHVVHDRRWPAEQSRASHRRRRKRWCAGRHEPGDCEDRRRSREPLRGARGRGARGHQHAGSAARWIVLGGAHERRALSRRLPRRHRVRPRSRVGRTTGWSRCSPTKRGGCGSARTLNGLFRYSAAGRFERYAAADGLPGARVPVIARGRRQQSVDWDRWRAGAIQEATRDRLYPAGRPRGRLRRRASSRMGKAASGRRRDTD